MRGEFKYTVTVWANSKEEATKVMQERICFEEDYGFEYELNYREQ